MNFFPARFGSPSAPPIEFATTVVTYLYDQSFRFFLLSKSIMYTYRNPDITHQLPSFAWIFPGLMFVDAEWEEELEEWRGENLGTKALAKVGGDSAAIAICVFQGNLSAITHVSYSPWIWIRWLELNRPTRLNPFGTGLRAMQIWL